jgi:hypothetical protein
MDVVHITIQLEELAHIVLGGAKRQVANIDIHEWSSTTNGKAIARSSEQYAGALQGKNGEE